MAQFASLTLDSVQSHLANVSSYCEELGWLQNIWNGTSDWPVMEYVPCTFFIISFLKEGLNWKHLNVLNLPHMLRWECSQLGRFVVVAVWAVLQFSHCSIFLAWLQRRQDETGYWMRDSSTVQCGVLIWCWLEELVRRRQFNNRQVVIPSSCQED